MVAFRRIVITVLGFALTYCMSPAGLARADGTSITFGNPGDIPIVGRWTRPYVPDEIGVYRPSTSTFYLDESGSPREIAFGNRGDRPVIGDWNGDGGDEVGVYRPANRTFYLRSSNGSVTDIVFGNLNDVPIIGDWNGNGIDEIGVYRPANRTIYRSGGYPPETLGNPGDVPVVHGYKVKADQVGVYRPSISTFFIGGRQIAYGNKGDIPIAGDWYNIRYDLPGVYRPSNRTFYFDRP